MDSPLPTTNGDDWVPPPESNAYMMRRVYIALIIISSSLVLVRLGTRAFVSKALGIDDLLATITLPVILALTSLQISIGEVGQGTSIAQIPPPVLMKFFDMVTTHEILFLLGLFLVRLCNLAFFPRLSKDKWFMRGIYAVGFLAFAITLIAVAVILTKCKAVGDLWNIANPNRDCRGPQAENTIMLFHAGMGIPIDIFILALPISVLFRKMKFSTKMVRVILIFCVGILSVVAGIIRLIYTVGDFEGDTTYMIGMISLWSTIEVHLGLWVACFPALQPLLRLLGDKIRFKKKNQASSDGKGRSQKPLVNTETTS